MKTKWEIRCVRIVRLKENDGEENRLSNIQDDSSVLVPPLLKEK